ncbi:hypothetical protein WR25_24824 [Diploscapter pachys]|uniref:histone acetyltransferase n=1 Tax=Diploscapter pachys TaxID=2018661 RepID=A0A2A2KJV7_9BILA|nr:hypothetical protein WR25_24824 [Diploscapter pachys]
MYICEFCLKYMKSSDILKNHQKKCDCRFPPGNEIYRDKDLSVFEVDGNLERIYCQNLCLLAKLFIDHKTLYYDVEPFLFYVATKLEYDGFHFVGYFSKEKYSAQKFNLSCIVTLPCFQGQGYGRFLIDFSYLLSRQEKLPGTPERPLSDLGRVAYSSYWKSALFEYFHEHLRKDGSVQVSMTDIANATGITFFDVCETLDALGWFVKNERGITLDINWWMVEAHWKKMKADKRRIWLSERALKWTPTVYTPSKDFAARSPLLSTPKRSPVASGSTPTGVSLAAGLGPGSRGGRKGASVNLKDKFEKDLPSTEDSTGSDNDEAKPKQNKKSNCRDRFFPGRAGRRDDSPDEDDQDEDGPSGGGKPQQKSSAKKRGRPPVSTSGGGGGGSSGNYRRKAPAPRTANAGPGTGTGTSTTDRSAGRKTAFEHPFGSSSEGSSEISSDSDELDSTYNLGSYHGNAYGSGNGGGAGRKPQKGKPLPNQQRKKRIPMKKPPGKSPGKVFPPNFGTRTRGKEQNSNSSKQQSSKSKEVQILKGNARCESSSTIPAIDSSTEAGTSGLVSGAATTSGRCHDIEGEDDIVASIPSGPVDRGPPPSSRVSRSSSRLERPLSRESSASGEGYFTDHHHSGACSDSSSQYDGSRGNTPRPIGDRVPDHEDAVNMGGDPDEDGPNRCDQEDNEPPPNLQMETYANVPVRERGKRQPSAENSSSDEAPPNLQAAFDPNEILDENDPRFSRVDGNSTDDEAPPQLSPVGIEGEIEPVYEDPEPPANVLDHRPSAPAKLYPVEQEEQLQHQDEVVQQTGIQEQQQMPEVQQQQVQPSCGSMGPFSQVGSHSMECMPSSVMHSTTPQQPYPGSLKQTTPGSVPSCQMQQSQTPDQQIAFMSPQVQQQGAICPNKQPNSVSSVHSQHNNSHEMIAGPLSQQGATFHSDPSTPLRSHHGASFGSPPQPIQASTSRQSAEGPANVSGHRRSGGGTSVDPVVSQQAGNVSGSSRQKSSRSSHHHPSQQTQLEQAQMVAQQQMVQQINLQQQGAQFYGIYGNYAYPNPASFYPPPTAQFEQFYHQYAQGYPSSSHSMYNQGAIIPPHPSFYPSAGTPNGFQAGTSFGGSSGSRGQGGVNPAAAAAAMNLPRYPPGAAHNDVQAQMNAMLPYGMYYQPANASNQFFGKQ